MIGWKRKNGTRDFFVNYAEPNPQGCYFRHSTFEKTFHYAHLAPILRSCRDNCPPLSKPAFFKVPYHKKFLITKTRRLLPRKIQKIEYFICPFAFAIAKQTSTNNVKIQSFNSIPFLTQSAQITPIQWIWVAPCVQDFAISHWRLTSLGYIKSSNNLERSFVFRFIYSF